MECESSALASAKRVVWTPRLEFVCHDRFDQMGAPDTKTSRRPSCLRGSPRRVSGVGEDGDEHVFRLA